MKTLVIRYSSLGDVVLAGAVTGALGPVTFLCRAAWAPVAALLPGVERVLVAEDRPSLTGFERIVDLHASPRSRWATLGLRDVRRVRRWDLRRRLRVWAKAGAPPPGVVSRYAEAAGTDPAPPPWIHLDRVESPDLLALCPGAAHATKRWPAGRYAALGRRWGGPVAVLGGPQDGVLCGAVAEAIGPDAESIVERGFTRTLAALGRARLVVAGDTGLLHLAAAAGLPVVGLYGPTTSKDGFWTWDAQGHVIERALSCRPCSLHGGERCPIGDHRCMEDITVEEVAARFPSR